MLLYFLHIVFMTFNSLSQLISSLSKSNASVNDRQSCQSFKYSFDKNSRSNTDSVSKPFHHLVALLPFPIKVSPGFINYTVHYETLWQTVLKYSCNAFYISQGTSEVVKMYTCTNS